MIDWLKKRLSPVKSDTPRWQHFAEALQEFWEENFDPEIERLRNLRSLYTADEAGQRKIVDEMGRYFEDGIPSANIPMTVARQQVELFQKHTITPLENAWRRLGIENAEWRPLYAHVADTYGDKFYLETDNVLHYLDGTWTLDQDPPIFLTQGSYMTCRGVIEIDLDLLEDFEGMDLLRRRVNQVKPLHIVFDGIRYRIIREDIVATLITQSYLDDATDLWDLGDQGRYVYDAIESAKELYMRLPNAKMAFGNDLSGLTVEMIPQGDYLMFGDTPEPVTLTDLGGFEYIDSETVRVIGVLQNQDAVGHTISAAGLVVDGVIVAETTFTGKVKESDESYSVEMTVKVPL
jgi:hypothetical protein